MPNRILREGILTSERIALLAWPAEVFYRRLMSVVDDFGRYHAHPMMLRAACYPLQLDKVREADITRWLAECEKSGLLALYDGPRGRYLEMLDFRQQVRAKDSKFPQPPPSAARMLSRCVADAQQMPADAHLDGGVVGDGGEDSVEPRSDSPPPFLLLPLVDGTEWPIAESEAEEWGRTFPAVDVRQELREMRAWCLAHPQKRKTQRGIAAFVVRWLGKEQDRGGGESSAPKADKFAGVT